MPSDSQPASGLRQISLLTFLAFASRGLTLPFIALYLTSLGFSGQEIGVILSIAALAQLIFGPLSHMLADRRGEHRRLFYGLQSGHILALFGMVLPFGKLWVSVANVARDSFQLPGVSLLSQLTVTRLEEIKQPIYGRLRAWGSFGYAVTTFVSGAIIALGGYSLLFILSAIINMAMFPFIRALPERTAEPSRHVHTEQKRPTSFYLLLVSVGLFQILLSVSTTFTFIYFKRDLGATDGLIGVIVSVAALSEILPMVLYQRFQGRASIYTLLVVGMIGQAILCVSFAFLTSSGPIVFLMLLRGTFYTLQSVSTVLLVARISHPSNVATNQALAQVTAPNLAILIASPLNGWIFDHLGPRVLLIFAALLAVVAALLLFAVRARLAAREDQMQESLNAQTMAAD